MVSPLVQGGLEIRVKVVIYLPSGRKNKQLVGMYESLIEPQIYPRREKFCGWFNFGNRRDCSQAKGRHQEIQDKRRCVDEEMFRPAEGHNRSFFNKPKIPPPPPIEKRPVVINHVENQAIEIDSD